VASTTTESEQVKITLSGVYAGPDGTAVAGTVLDLPEQKAREMLEAQAARPYDAKRDAKKPMGLQTPEQK
jgi:hypothetical protein